MPIMSLDASGDVKDMELPESLPVLTLRGTILFPTTIIPVAVGRDKSIKLIREACAKKRLIGAAAQLDPEVDVPQETDMFRIGTVAKILKIIEMPDGSLTAILQGLKRFYLDRVVSYDPYMWAEVSYINDILPAKNDKDMDLIVGAVKDAAMQVIELSPNLPKEAEFALKNIEGADYFINFVSSNVELEQFADRLKLLGEGDLKKRGLLLLEMLNRQIDILKLKDEIQNKVKREINQQQREMFLNNQLKTIQEELGMDGSEQDISDLRTQAKSRKWSAEMAERFEKEVHKLEMLNPSSPDYNVQYSFCQFAVELPWGELSKDNLDLNNARKVLDHDHFGLDSVKDRIIEYLAVLKLKGDMKSPIICLYGPPGVGKTSLGQSIAKALGREYGRISLGGLHDESEIRGHRRTYIGAMPGRIISTIKKCGTSNPVIVLDEIDKVGDDHRGDPASALLEVLDPEQNAAFHDNYLDFDYDLSNVLFITTANDASAIHPALRDRMEMIQVSGYLAEEKLEIANKYLVPKQRKAHGLKASDLKIRKEALATVIDEYTRESGVRGLDRQIAKLARVTAKRIACDEERPERLASSDVRKILGLPTNQHDIQKGNEGPGVVTGLAWTEMGGEILFVECSPSQGKGVLSTTGNLGDVMKESVQIAMQYLKAHTDLIGIPSDTFQNKDIHIHVPEGAIPKDGPSAGITMVCAMASALCGKPVRHGIAMTGEITLRGKVLPVGGIKEKILAAKRAGIGTIVLSSENRRDIEQIKQVYIEGLNFIFVDTIEDVIRFAFPE